MDNVSKGNGKLPRREYCQQLQEIRKFHIGIWTTSEYIWSHNECQVQEEQYKIYRWRTSPTTTVSADTSHTLVAIWSISSFGKTLAENRERIGKGWDRKRI